MRLATRRDWITQAAEALNAEEEITIFPTGDSMLPRIGQGDAVTLHRPPQVLEAGDAVLARVRRRREVLVLHQVLEVGEEAYLIGNASGRVDGWVEARDVLGVVVRVERPSST